MKNLKVGDVVEKKCHFMEHQIEWGGDCYCCEKCGTVLKDYTPVKPEKTLEEKFEEYRNDEEGIDCAYRCIVDLAQIAEEHYKDKQD